MGEGFSTGPNRPRNQFNLRQRPSLRGCPHATQAGAQARGHQDVSRAASYRADEGRHRAFCRQKRETAGTARRPIRPDGCSDCLPEPQRRQAHRHLSSNTLPQFAQAGSGHPDMGQRPHHEPNHPMAHRRHGRQGTNTVGQKSRLQPFPPRHAEDHGRRHVRDVQHELRQRSHDPPPHGKPHRARTGHDLPLLRWSGFR